MAMFADAIRRQLQERAAGLLQALKDDKAGTKRLTASRRRTAMVLLRKVMTAAEINAELKKVTAAKD